MYTSIMAGSAALQSSYVLSHLVQSTSLIDLPHLSAVIYFQACPEYGTSSRTFAILKILVRTLQRFQRRQATLSETRSPCHGILSNDWATRWLPLTSIVSQLQDWPNDMFQMSEVSNVAPGFSAPQTAENDENTDFSATTDADASYQYPFIAQIRPLHARFLHPNEHMVSYFSGKLDRFLQVIRLLM